MEKKNQSILIYHQNNFNNKFNKFDNRDRDNDNEQNNF